MLDLSRVERVLVHAPNWVGDIVMATPALRAIRHGLPDRRITLLTRRLGRKILDGAPWFDEVLCYDRHGADRGFRQFLRKAWTIRERRIDLCLLFPNSLSSACLAWLSRCGRRAGYAPGRSWLLTDGLTPVMEGRRRRPTYMVDYYGDLLTVLGIGRGRPHLELFVTDEEESECRAFLARHGIGEGERIVCLNPGASFGPSKLWRADRFARVSDELARRQGARTIILCGPGEEPLAREIGELTKEPSVSTADDMVGLGPLKALMRRTSLLVTTDTGARHFAVAFRKPVVVLMGPTDPRYTDGNLEHTVVLREPASCAPCHLKVCPIDHRCMERITPERVIESALRLVSEQDGS